MIAFADEQIASSTDSSKRNLAIERALLVVGDDQVDLPDGFHHLTRSLPAAREDPAVTGP